MKHIPGPNAQLKALNARAGHTTSEVGKAHQAMLERGRKLGELDEQTQKMVQASEAFSIHASQLVAKYKDKKWYQL